MPSIMASNIAVPPLACIAAMAWAMVAGSSVGPVIVPTWALKGATIARSFSRSERARRSAAARTKSMRRPMLWLLSTSRSRLVGMVSRATRSIFCGDPFSVTPNNSGLRFDTNFPDLSYTLVSSRMLVTSVLSFTSKGGRTIVSLNTCPEASAACTTSSRRSKGLSSTQSTA